MSEIEHEQPQENVKSTMWRCIKERDWDKLREAYQHNLSILMAKLTASHDTVLHIVVSQHYHYQIDADEQSRAVEMLMDLLPPDQVGEILGSRNDKGNTPLHLAAAGGRARICRHIALKKPELITYRNLKGETPLFLAAQHGRIDAFLCLDEVCADHRCPSDNGLLRRNDGDTVLHAAIAGEYFELALAIIRRYPKLVHSVNEEGFSPLHILARKPSSFPSSRSLQPLDWMIYQWVEENGSSGRGWSRFKTYLKSISSFGIDLLQNMSKLTHRQKDEESRNIGTNGTISPRPSWSRLKTYLKTTPLFGANLLPNMRKLTHRRKDERSRNIGIEGTSSSGLRGRVADLLPTTRKQTHSQKDEGSRNTEGGLQSRQQHDHQGSASYQPNYAIQFYKLVKTLVLYLLFGLLFGVRRIDEIRDLKERQMSAITVMAKLIEAMKHYYYGDDGRNPREYVEIYAERIVLPATLPPEHDTHSSRDHNVPEIYSEDEEDRDGSKLRQRQNQEAWRPKQFASEKVDVSETPILIAAKMGIHEMVEKIIENFPMSIQDTDANGKNALLLTVEYRHIRVFGSLMRMYLPESLFQQVDKEGNGVLHLAAKFEEYQSQPFEGFALLMQWESKWFEYVKLCIPPNWVIPYNIRGETADDIFRRTHEQLVIDEHEWLIKTSKSCSVVAVLIASVVYGTTSSVPGGFDQYTGYPIFKKERGFHLYSLASLLAFCFSVTTLVCFLVILISRSKRQRDFRSDLPRKFLLGSISLLISIAAMLISFCTGNFLVLQHQLPKQAVLAYAIACLPLTYFAVAKLPFYFGLMYLQFTIFRRKIVNFT